MDIETRWMSDYNQKEARTTFSQPGIRYSQAESLIKSLMQDDKFRDLSLVERKRVTETCEIYEIKHSDKIVLQQCRHLLDRQKCEDTAFRYGTIIGKYVIYRGATTSLVQAGVSTQEDVAYLNVEEYLKKL